MLSPSCEWRLQESVFGGPAHRTPGAKDAEAPGCPEAARRDIRRHVRPLAEERGENRRSRFP
eukprot:1703013-Alexandrium_andersonii.AAC.1